MSEDSRYFMGIVLTIGIIGLSLFVIHRFIPSLLWAGIIAMATHPLYKRWQTVCRYNQTFSAASFTVLVSILLVLPLTWLVTVLIRELQIFIHWIVDVQQYGKTPPAVLNTIPWFGNELATYWQENFGAPGGIKTWLQGLHLSLTPASYYLKKVGLSMVNRSVQLGFTLMCLFFFYRDGNVMIKQINTVGEVCLAYRWANFAEKLPQTLQSTVNGTILVGLVVGLVMGTSYSFLDFPAPVLAGFFTAVAAMIPFVVPVVFVIVALVIWAQGSLLNAIFLLVLGTVVMFIADHFVKPVLIGNTTQLPFLAVLFGILGGVETLGLIGLFLGPMIMVLFMILWRESLFHGEA